MVCRTYSPEYIPDSALDCFNSGNKIFLAILTETLMRHVIDIDKVICVDYLSGDEYSRSLLCIFKNRYCNYKSQIKKSSLFAQVLCMIKNTCVPMYAQARYE